MEWRCEICNKLRPDDKISVNKETYSPMGIEVDRNVNYCNDNLPCLEGAQIKQDGFMERLTFHKIEGKGVTSDHIGYAVLYVPRHINVEGLSKPDIESTKGTELGWIKRWNDKFIFVDFGYNVKATPPDLLRWGIDEKDD